MYCPGQEGAGGRPSVRHLQLPPQLPLLAPGGGGGGRVSGRWQRSQAGGQQVLVSKLNTYQGSLLRISGEDRLSRQMAGSRRSVIGPPGNLGSNTDLSGTNYNPGEVNYNDV